MRNTSHAIVLTCIAACATLTLHGHAQTQKNYPVKAVRFISPFSMLMRMLGETRWAAAFCAG